MEQLHEILDDVMEGEDFDWNDFDENHKPRKIFHVVPSSFRRKKHFFLMVYWDPLVEAVENLPACLGVFVKFLKCLPLFGFFASVLWLIRSWMVNLQYEVSSCEVEKLPSRFRPVDNMDPLVSGVYSVKRTYPPTARGPEGYIIEECEVVVDCDEVRYSQTGNNQDNVCMRFKAWSWGEKIDCFYNKDDFYGDKGLRLYCHSLPEELRQEQFTIVVSSAVLVLSWVIIAALWWRRKKDKDQADQENEDAVALEAEVEDAKRIIEERDAQGANHHAGNGVEDDSNYESGGDSEGDGPDLANRGGVGSVAVSIG